jgi:hypothetical protein
MLLLWTFFMAALSLALFILGVWLAWQPGRERLAGLLLCLGAALTFSGGFSVAGPLLLAGILLLALGCGTLLSVTY